ncbi:MAG: AAA family ATPase [Fimbriimonadaceae bacterium]|nr:AAA family ATPase [Fimbriimonadaceae bacterium]
MTAGLDAVAITDHHDLEFVKLLRHIVASEFADEALVVWPGMELTLDVPCQALLLFDSELPDSLLDQAYTALGLALPAQIPAKGPAVKRLPIEKLSDLSARLDGVPGVKGRYIVLPNVSDGGQSTLIRAGFANKYTEMPCVGGYVDGSASKLRDGHLKKLNGKDRAYGNKKIAIIQTNDSRENTVESLSEHPSWIKWSEPTAEALRQACLACESRISTTDPRMTGTWISSVALTASTFLGNLNQEFSPQLNALIGGRGSGKTTIIEYVRWCLCRPATSARRPTGPQQRDIVEDTLKPVKGMVAVDVTIDGTLHTVRRDSTSGAIHLRIGDGEFLAATQDEIRELLPIAVYGQKELSTVALESDQVRAFLYSNIKNEQERLREAREANLVTATSAHARWVQLRQARADQASARKQVASIRTRLEQARKGLKGLSDSERSELARASKTQEEELLLAMLRSELESIVSTLRTVYSNLRSWPDYGELVLDNLPHKDSIENLVAATQSAIKSSSDAIKMAGVHLKKLVDAEGVFASSEALVRGEIATAKKRGVQLEQRSKQSEAQVKQIRFLEVEEKKLLQRLSAIEARVKVLAEAGSEFSKLLDQRAGLLRQRGKLLKDEARRVEQATDKRFSVYVGVSEDIQPFIEKLQEVLKGSNIRGAKFEEMAQRFSDSTDRIQLWRGFVEDLDKVIGAKHEAIDITSLTLQSLRGVFSDTEIDRAAEVLKYQDYASIIGACPEDDVVFQFRTETGDLIPFGKASAGQQASVLLTALLGQVGPPLLIDQPEDDLDSQFISSLVEKIWSAKEGRQLIFASHNANLVVNGDAELVVCLESTSTAAGVIGEIYASGAIDKKPVREAITRIMEGGEKAFKMRKAKYGF